MKKHFIKGHSILLRKYIIYNLCLVLVPVLVLASVYYANTQQQAIHEFELIHQYALAQTADNVNRRLNEFSVIATQIANDTKLTPFELRHTYYSQINGIERLRMYFSRTDFLENLILYYYQDDMLYSSNGIYSLKTFSEYSYDFIGPWSYDDFFQLLYNKERLGTSPYQCYLRRKNDDAGVNLFILTSPCPPDNVSSYGTLIGIIKQNYFQSLFNTMESDLISASLILDVQKRILFTTHNNLHIDQLIIDNFMQMEELADMTNTKIKINGEAYSLLILRSSLNGWYYVTVIPHSQFIRRFITVQTPTLMLLVFLSFAGILLAIILAANNYRPIQNMGKALNMNKLSRRSNNELTNIKHAIQEIVSSNREMQLQLDENKQIILQNYLMNLINGYSDGKQQVLQRKLEQEGILLPGPYYCVLVLRLPARRRAEIREYILIAIQTNNLFNAYAIDSLYQNMITVIFSLDEPVHDRKRLAKYVSDIINENFQIRLQIGVGLSYQMLTQVSRSYFEAITAYESLLDDEDYHYIAYYDDLEKDKFTDRFWYPSRAQLRLYQAIRQGNSRIVSELIEEIRQSIQAFCMPMNSARLRFMTYSIIVQLMSLIKEMNMEDSDKVIDNLIHYVNIDDFFIQLEEFCQKILCVLERSKQKEREILFNQIISYIDSHYWDQDISQNKIADQLGITQSYMSRFFRENAKVNFIDYLTDKRMSHACSLLIDTDLKIREIVEQVGYIDLTSFTRKFTKLFGISPGRYRNDKRKERREAL